MLAANSDFLPDMADKDAMEQVLELRKRTDTIPPEVIQLAGR